MTYAKKSWASGTTIGAADLNNIEQGVVDQMLRTPLRQAILSGAVSGTTGAAAFLQAGAGLTVNLLGGTTPLALSFANGGRPDTAVGDLTAVIATNVSPAWSGLTNGATCYLYVDNNAGVITYGFETVAPVTQAFAPAAPATGLHWFDTSTWTMKRWSGAAWVTFTRIFVGHAVTSGGAVTSAVAWPIGCAILQGHMVMPGTTNIRVRKNASQSFSGPNTVKVTFSTIDRDVAGDWDAANNRHTAKVAETLLVCGSGSSDANPTFVLYKNGAAVAGTDTFGNPAGLATASTVGYAYIGFATTISLNPGDYIELYWSCSAGPTMRYVELNIVRIA